MPQTVTAFLAQGIPTKLVATDAEQIKWLMRKKLHDWVKKFYLEQPDLLAEFVASSKRTMPREHVASFTKFRRKWDTLNRLHHYTGMK